MVNFLSLNLCSYNTSNRVTSSSISQTKSLSVFFFSRLFFIFTVVAETASNMLPQFKVEFGSRRTVRNMLLWKSLPIFQQNRTRLHHHVMYEPLAREYETLLSFIGQKPNIADF
jgi:hypothetical protein